MVTTAFSDEIVKATELRNKQSHWLKKASQKPVTVTYGQHSLTILNRETVSEIYLGKHYLELALQYCHEIFANETSKVFPWVEYLDKGDKLQFQKEFVGAVSVAIRTNKWNGVEILLDDWKATAETMHDPQAMKALTKLGRKSAYIPLEV